MRNALLVFTVLLAGLVFCAATAVAGDFDGGEITYQSTTFSHSLHVGEYGFDCGSCHDGLFAMEAGNMTRSADFSMETISRDSSCGACHDGQMAFSADANCTVCHEKGGDIYFDEPVKSVRFSHQAHVEEMGFECGSCHGDTFSMKARDAQESADFNMQALYAGKYCGSCHDGSMAFASDTRCASCHIGVRGYERNHSGKAKDQLAGASH